MVVIFHIWILIVLLACWDKAPCSWSHWRNFTLKSDGDQWRRQDFLSGWHDDREAGAEGASIEAPSGVRYGEGCPLPSWLGGLGSVVSSPSGVLGGVPAAIAFSAYIRPQNASGSKKNTIFLPKSDGDSHHHLQKWWWQVTIVT